MKSKSETVLGKFLDGIFGEISATEFEQQNAEFGVNQKEYRNLPAFLDKSGDVVTCWKVPLKHRVAILFTGRFFIWQRTFNKPLNPILPLSVNPFVKK